MCQFHLIPVDDVCFIDLPTAEEVCTCVSLNDVKINYSEAEYKDLTSYAAFKHHVLPILAGKNPKVIQFMGNATSRLRHIRLRK